MRYLILFLSTLLVLSIYASFCDLLYADSSGCCSWHEGVAGCDEESGMLLCNDGELSPTCECECDTDGDLWVSEACGGDDCDDTNPAINPDADEICDDVDNNCDGRVDEGCCGRGVLSCLGVALLIWWKGREYE